LSLLGVEKETVDTLRKIAEPTPKTAFTDKARSLDRLRRDLDENIAANPELEQSLRDIYEVERRKILES
jgi:hypothetical protein